MNILFTESTIKITGLKEELPFDFYDDDYLYDDDYEDFDEEW